MSEKADKMCLSLKKLLFSTEAIFATRVTIFSLCERRTGSLRVIMSADVKIFTQKHVKTKKRSLSPQMSFFLLRNK